MKRILFILSSFVCFSVYLNGQTHSSTKEEYENYRKNITNKYANYQNQVREKYNSFRDSINAEYTRFMSRKWEWYESNNPIPAPAPKPLPPVVKPEEEIDKPLQNNPIIFQDLVLPVLLPKPPCPLIEQTPEEEEVNTPIPVTPPVEKQKCFSFMFYDIPCKVCLNDDFRYKLKDTKEEAVAEMWRQLSSKSYNSMIVDCLNLKEKLKLCDWAYFKMLEQLSHDFISTPDEATVLHAFLFAQSGYKVLIARGNSGRLCLLPATDAILYGIRYYSIDGEKFYQLKENKENGLHVFSKLYPKATAMSMRINQEQDFLKEKTEKRTLTSSKRSNISANITNNIHLLDFYNNFPKTTYDIYANTPLCSSIKNDLYPVLKEAIRGKSEEASANILINFVQTAFKYENDYNVWGVEDRIFFADETIFYPYSDCEDRAILFSRLVRDLIGLDVVLVSYPGHLATAVHFNENIKGDYLDIEGKHYLICDPTYINANIGDAMPQFKNSQVEVIVLKSGQHE